MEVVWFEITGLRPFVPTVEGDERLLLRMGDDVVFRHAEGLFEFLWRVVAAYVFTETLETRVVVPSDGDVRVVGDGVVGGDFLPFLLDIDENVLVAAVHVREMDELIVGDAVEAQRVELGAVQAAVCVEAAEIRAVLAPGGGLQMEAGEARADRFFSEPVQCLAAFIAAAEAVDEIFEFVDHEDGLAVDGVVVRLGEIAFDDAMDDDFELLAGDGTAPDDGVAVVVGEIDVPIVVGVMVGPHEIEFHAIAVGGLEEAVVETLFEEGAVVEPIPVVDEDIDAVVGGRVDFHLHDVWIGLVDVAPKGLARPVVERCAFDGVFDGLPFADPFRPEHSGARLVSCVGGPDEGGDIDGLILEHGNTSIILNY